MATASHLSFWQEILESGVPAMAGRLSDEEAIAMTEQYGTHNYKPLRINIVRGEGARVWDGSGREYIDFIGAYSAVAHGHLSEAVIRAVRDQLSKVTLTSRATYNTEVALFLRGLAEYCGMDMVCPMNSGAEANETAIKIARKWAYTVKGVPSDQAEIIACTDNFHGRTTTLVSFSTEEEYRRDFGPFTPGFRIVPFGDVAALEAAITPHTAAFIAEPIQAEGGIIVPPEGYLAQVRALCDRHSVLLIWDEVQTGFCRTGAKFAWMHEQAEPDIMALGKPLGGGIMPVSAAVGRRSVMEVLRVGQHGSTFGGNPLGAVVALAALAEMEVEDYAGRSAKSGARMLTALRGMDLPHIVDVRGRGLLIGLEVSDQVDTKALSQSFVAEGVITKETRHRTFRFTPPIMTDDATIDEGLARIERALRRVLLG